MIAAVPSPGCRRAKAGRRTSQATPAVVKTSATSGQTTPA